MRLTFDIEPMGAVRMTRRSKYKDPAAQRYLSYKQYIQYKILEQYKGDVMQGAIGITVWFHMPIPKSLAKKVKPGEYHTKKPDIDNLTKGLFDAMNKMVWGDDGQVSDMTVFKVYSEHPGIELEVVEYGETKATPQETKQATEGTKKG